MKRVRNVVFLLAWSMPLALSQVSSSQNQPAPIQETPFFDGRPLVDVAVSVPSELAEAGLSGKAVAASIKAFLAENGIKSLANLMLGDYDPAIADSHGNFGRLILTVRIIHIPEDGRVAYYCRAEFREMSSPLRKEAAYLRFAAAWDDDAYGIIGRARLGDLDCMKDLAQRFALRYLRDNQSTNGSTK